MKIPDLIRSIESMYVETKLTNKVQKVLHDEYNIRHFNILNLEPTVLKPIDILHPYSVFLISTIAYVIFQHPNSFTNDFNVVEIPKEFNDNDAIEMVSILRRVGKQFGLQIRLLNSREFVIQWEKEYLLIKSDEVSDVQIKNEILSFIKPDLSNYTEEVFQIYFNGIESYDELGKFKPTPPSPLLPDIKPRKYEKKISNF